MHEIRTEITIESPAKRVWGILTDFPAHAEWNPFVRQIEGEPKKGARLTIRIQPPGGRGMTFRPTVLAAEAGRELRWLGRLVMPGLFDGEHYFLLEEVEGGRTRLTHGERFSGVLVGFAKGGLEGGTRAGFEEMNRALKARAEGGRTNPAF
jgi:hypothetical protein